MPDLDASVYPKMDGVGQDHTPVLTLFSQLMCSRDLCASLGPSWPTVDEGGNR